MAYNLEQAVGSINIAEDLEDSVLERIGHELGEAIEADDMSRQTWLDDMEDWLKLASQVRDYKSYPWPKASNVKYPLMTVAALQFHSRAMPGLINSSQPVRARVIGKDPSGEKLKRSNRVEKYMSYQVMEEMDEWVDETDRLLFVLPMVGICYKKSFYSENSARVKSVLVMPQDLILNYHAKDYLRARMTHSFLMDQNEVVELQNQGIFLDIELDAPYKDVEGTRDEIIGLTHAQPTDDEPYDILESHCWLDLDEDGYKEPYIVVLHRDSKKILRIVARWDAGDIVYSEKGDVVKITPTEYFTPFIFLPDPNSQVYGIGFGRLLGPTNETVNTLINQLVDAGTLSNLQGGFLSRGIKLGGGSTRFRPGEWKIVNTTGDDLRKGIFPMPIREPSGVLFNLLSLLIQGGEQISSVSDIMLGENPGQNQPATTTMAVLEQGLKVFTSIHKRLHRALAKEYKKIYKLNGKYLNVDRYQAVLDEGIVMPEIPQGMPPQQAQAIMMQAQQQQQEVATIEDFNDENLDIMPFSDPAMASGAQRAVKANSLLEKAMAGLPVNIGEATKRALEAEGHEDIDDLMRMPPPQPSIDQLNFQLDTVKTQIEAFKAYHEAIAKMAKAEAEEVGTQLDTYRAVVDDNIKLFGLEKEMSQQTGGQSGSSGPSAPAV